MAKDPDHSDMLAILARSLAELDRFSGAVLVAQQLMAAWGKSRANLVLGRLYDMMNAPEQAVTATPERGLAEAGEPLRPRNPTGYK